MFEKLSRKIGFTLIEIRVLLFITVICALGLIYKLYFLNNPATDYKIYDYSSEDSLFNISKNKIEKDIADLKSSDKEFDIKSEVLQLNKPDYSKNEPLPLPAEASINLNTADVNELMRLPGIGEKTAVKIIAYRKKVNGFKSIDELIEVKGIGTSKLNKIKKFLYIE